MTRRQAAGECHQGDRGLARHRDVLAEMQAKDPAENPLEPICVCTALPGDSACGNGRLVTAGSGPHHDGAPRPINQISAAVPLILGIADFTWAAGAVSFSGIALGSVAAVVIYQVMRFIGRRRGIDVSQASRTTLRPCRTDPVRPVLDAEDRADPFRLRRTGPDAVR